MYYVNIEEFCCDGVDWWNVIKLIRNRYVDELIMLYILENMVYFDGEKR